MALPTLYRASCSGYASASCFIVLGLKSKLKIMKPIVILTCLTVFLYSCDDNDCGEDINLGSLKLTETTQQFMPYAGDEVLTFEDNEGVQHILKSKEGRKTFDTRLVVSTLCRGDVALLDFDDQEQYYQSQSEEIVFYDQSGDQVFYINSATSFEEASQLDSIAIYDQLAVYSSIGNSLFGDISIITSERQNTVSSSWSETVLNDTRFIGDTVLFGREFTQVYQSSPFEGRYAYYNPLNGIVAYEFNEGEYWVLVDSEK